MSENTIASYYPQCYSECNWFPRPSVLSHASQNYRVYIKIRICIKDIEFSDILHNIFKNCITCITRYSTNITRITRYCMNIHNKKLNIHHKILSLHNKITNVKHYKISHIHHEIFENKAKF